MAAVPSVQMEVDVMFTNQPSQTALEASVPVDSSTSPEVQLLLACAKAVVDSKSAARIRTLLNKPIDWMCLLENARKHGVLALLYRSLKNVSPELVPEKILAQLRGEFHRNALDNLTRTRELILVLQGLEGKAIPALPFKGPVLSASIYGDLALRQFGDLDILIHRRHLKTGKEYLLSRGYTVAAEPSWIGRRFPKLSLRKDFVFVSRDQQTIIELHWQLTGNHFRIPFDMKHFWNQLDEVSLAGFKVKNLQADELFLYLCLHGSRHSWQRLLWLCDINEMIRSCHLDLAQLVQRASQLGVERTLTLGLYLAHELFDAQIPEGLLSQIRAEKEIAALAARIKILLFQDSHETYSNINYWYHHHLTVRERFSDRARLHLHYLRRYLHLMVTPNEKDQELFTLPKSLTFLQYLFRPLRLLNDRLRAAINRRKEKE